MASEELDEGLSDAYDLMDELWPQIAERWPDDPVGRLRHVIVANIEHKGPAPTPKPKPAARTTEVQPMFKKGAK